MESSRLFLPVGALMSVTIRTNKDGTTIDYAKSKDHQPSLVELQNNTKHDQNEDRILTIINDQTSSKQLSMGQILDALEEFGPVLFMEKVHLGKSLLDGCIHHVYFEDRNVVKLVLRKGISGLTLQWGRYRPPQ